MMPQITLNLLIKFTSSHSPSARLGLERFFFIVNKPRKLSGRFPTHTHRPQIPAPECLMRARSAGTTSGQAGDRQCWPRVGPRSVLRGASSVSRAPGGRFSALGSAVRWPVLHLNISFGSVTDSKRGGLLHLNQLYDLVSLTCRTRAGHRS